MSKPINILSIDSLGGLMAGFLTLILSPLLAQWYGWTIEFVWFVGASNIVYGCFSGSVVLYSRQKNSIPNRMTIFLILANSLWAGQCFTQVWWLQDQASFFGIAHLILEGFYVGILAYWEAKVILPHTV